MKPIHFVLMVTCCLFGIGLGLFMAIEPRRQAVNAARQDGITYGAKEAALNQVCCNWKSQFKDSCHVAPATTQKTR